jgi:hypothetical protein
MLGVVASVAALSQPPPPRALVAQEGQFEHHGHGHDTHGHDHEHRQHDLHREPMVDRPTVWLEDEACGYRMSAGIVAEPDDSREIVATFSDVRTRPLEPIEVEVAMALPERGIEPVTRRMAWDGEA